MIPTFNRTNINLLNIEYIFYSYFINIGILQFKSIYSMCGVIPTLTGVKANKESQKDHLTLFVRGRKKSF
jgi:hypothetical protein